MKRILSALFALLAFPCLSHAGRIDTYFKSSLGQFIISSGTVAAGPAGVSYDSSTIASFPGSTTGSANAKCTSGGCTLVVGLINYGSVPFTSVTVAGGGSLTLSTATYGGAQGHTEIWASTFTIGAGTPLVTANLGSSAFFEMVPITFTGANAANPINVKTGSIAGSGTASIVSSGTTTTNKEYLFAVAFQNNQTTLSVGGGAFVAGQYNADPNFFYAGIGAYAGPITPAGLASITLVTSSWSQPSMSMVSITP